MFENFNLIGVLPDVIRSFSSTLWFLLHYLLRQRGNDVASVQLGAHFCEPDQSLEAYGRDFFE